MTKWIVSAPLKGTDLMKNFVCFTEVELRKLLEQYPDASVEMKDSHLEDYPEMKDYSLISTAQTENYIQVKDARYTLDEFNRIGELLLGRNLTDDQQVVLDYLKKMCPPELGVSAMVTTYCLVDDNINDNWQEYSEEIPEHIEALQKLSVSEENQVLAAFAEWGIKEDNQ